MATDLTEKFVPTACQEVVKRGEKTIPWALKKSHSYHDTPTTTTEVAIVLEGIPHWIHPRN